MGAWIESKGSPSEGQTLSFGLILRLEASSPPQEEDPPCGERIRCSWALVEMAMSLQSALPEQVAGLAPLQIGRAPTPS